MGGSDEEMAHQRYLVQTEKEQNEQNCQMLEQELGRARVRMTQVGENNANGRDHVISILIPMNAGMALVTTRSLTPPKTTSCLPHHNPVPTRFISKTCSLNPRPIHSPTDPPARPTRTSPPRSAQGEPRPDASATGRTGPPRVFTATVSGGA